MKTFPARFSGRCARTGYPIHPGDSIFSVARGRYALAAPPIGALEADPEAAAGRYMAQSMARSVSNIWTTSTGAELYRNKRGRCEDAPCCGCCNV
jgi:hypothetical protein